MTKQFIFNFFIFVCSFVRCCVDEKIIEKKRYSDGGRLEVMSAKKNINIFAKLLYLFGLKIITVEIFF